MISIISFILFTALYILYYTSKKAKLYYGSPFEKWMQKNPKPTSLLGLGLLIVSYVSLLFLKSVIAATLSFIIITMVFTSLIVILKPIKKINAIFVIVIFIISSIIELYYS